MFDSWIKLPKIEDVHKINSQKEITDLYNKLEEDRKIIQNVIINNTYKEDGTPNYELLLEIEIKKNELLDIYLNLISVTEYLIYKKDNISEDRVFDNMYYNNKLREASQELIKAETKALAKKIEFEMNKLYIERLESQKLLYAYNKEITENIKKAENNFITILGIFIAVFSIIQVNYNLFEKMSNLRLTDIILFASVVNLSIFSIILGLFEILKKYNNDKEKFSISLLLIPLLFIGLIIFCLNYRTICFFY